MLVEINLFGLHLNEFSECLNICNKRFGLNRADQILSLTKFYLQKYQVFLKYQVLL